jgi:hypothetical protein
MGLLDLILGLLVFAAFIEPQPVVEAYAELNCSDRIYTGWQHQSDPNYLGATVYERTRRALWKGGYKVVSPAHKVNRCLIS